MFRFFNGEGMQLAQYQSLSEAQTWVGMWPKRRDEQVGAKTDANNFEVHNSAGNVVLRVSGPKAEDGKPGLLDTI